MPILKQSGTAHTKKRSRIDRQMISAPLGDFRHTMHVGRGGDVFGDTSFLSNHGPSQPTEAPPSPKENGASRPATEEQDFQEGKMTADSVSQLSQSSGIESGSGSWASSPANSGSPKEDHPAVWNMGTSKGEVDRLDWLSPSECGLKHAESILSFHLDLGPSIMDEVLGVMDKGAPAGDWRRMEDQYDFGYKFSPEEVGAEKSHPHSPSPYAVVDPPVIQYSPAPPPSNERVREVRDSASSSASGTLEENHSSYEEDSEEEKRSVYEGIANGPAQPGRSMASGSDGGQEEEEEEDEEVGQGYTFDDDDSDDEIGV